MIRIEKELYHLSGDELCHVLSIYSQGPTDYAET